jgi:hypothetical protein
MVLHIYLFKLNRLFSVKKLTPYLLFGAIVPDLFKIITRIISPELQWLFYPTHSPLFMLFVFYNISLLFHQDERIFVIKGCTIGMVLHFIFDLMQINYGGGYYMPFFPFSYTKVSFGLINTEASIYFLPFTFLITGIIIFSKNNK